VDDLLPMYPGWTPFLFPPHLWGRVRLGGRKRHLARKRAMPLTGQHPHLGPPPSRGRKNYIFFLGTEIKPDSSGSSPVTTNRKRLQGMGRGHAGKQACTVPPSDRPRQFSCDVVFVGILHLNVSRNSKTFIGIYRDLSGFIGIYFPIGMTRHDVRKRGDEVYGLNYEFLWAFMGIHWFLWGFWRKIWASNAHQSRSIP